jgi:hypothetical protein
MTVKKFFELNDAENNLSMSGFLCELCVLCG